jgi:CBS domain-containing membrane protein
VGILKRNQKIRKHHLIFQMGAAVLFVMLVLVALDSISASQVVWAVGAGSLASSAYLVFAMPSAYPSKAHRVIFGYVVGIVAGEIIRGLVTLLMAKNGHTHMLFAISSDANMYWLSGAFAVGLSMWLMVLLGVEHPPAAGFSLVFVIEMKHYSAIFVILGLAVLLGLIRYLFRRVLKDLGSPCNTP